MIRDPITTQDIDAIFADRDDAVYARHDAALDVAWDAAQCKARGARELAALDSASDDTYRDDAGFDAARGDLDLSMTSAEVSAIEAAGGWCANPLFRELWGSYLIELCGDRDELRMGRTEFEELGEAATLAALDNWTPATDLAN